MNASDELHRLVHSLSPSEKRYFRKFIKTNAPSGASNSQQLFDALLGQEKFDQGRLLTRFKKAAFAKNLAFEKNHLFKQILKCLRQLHQDKQVFFQIRSQIMDIQFMYDRRLFNAAAKRLRKTMQLAEASEDFPSLIQLHLLKRRIYKEFPKQKQPYSLEELDREYQELQERQELYFKYYQLYDQLVLTTRESGRIRGGQGSNPLENLEQHLLLKNPPPKTEFNANNFYLQIKALLANTSGQQKVALEWFTELLNWWESHPYFCEINPDRYKAVLGNFLAISAILGSWEDFSERLQRYRQLSSPNLHDRFRTELQANYLETLYLLHLPEPDLSHLASIETWFQKLEAQIEPSYALTFQFHFGLIYLQGQDARKALEWFNYLLNLPKIQERSQVQAASRVFQLVAHLDLGNFDLAVDLGRNLKRSLNRKQQLFPYESLLLNAVLAIPGHLSLQEFQSWKEKVGDLLQALEEDQEERNAIGLNELIRWARIRPRSNKG